MSPAVPAPPSAVPAPPSAVSAPVSPTLNFSGSFVGYRVEEELANVGAATAVGRTPDVTGGMTVAGTSIAFAGTGAPLLDTILTTWAIKVAWEALATPITYLVANGLKRSEGMDVFDAPGAAGLHWNEDSFDLPPGAAPVDRRLVSTGSTSTTTNPGGGGGTRAVRLDLGGRLAATGGGKLVFPCLGWRANAKDAGKRLRCKDCKHVGATITVERPQVGQRVCPRCLRPTPATNGSYIVQM